MHARDPKDESIKAFRLFDDDETGASRVVASAEWGLACGTSASPLRSIAVLRTLHRHNQPEESAAGGQGVGGEHD